MSNAFLHALVQLSEKKPFFAMRAQPDYSGLANNNAIRGLIGTITAVFQPEKSLSQQHF
jgi:hypothetical protein